MILSGVALFCPHSNNMDRTYGTQVLVVTYAGLKPGATIFVEPTALGDSRQVSRIKEIKFYVDSGLTSPL